MEKISPVVLALGAGHIEHLIRNADELLCQYRTDIGSFYLDYQPITPANKIAPDDIAVTLLINSQAGWKAFHSLQEHADEIDLASLPQKPLEHTSQIERRQIAALIAKMAQFPGFAASLTTKLLHKKRPDLIPILDNQAIFGAYMNPDWPRKKARTDSIKDESLICSALDWIAFDISRLENMAAWGDLLAIEPARSRIELFDSVWWMYFRSLQPVFLRKDINMEKS